MKLNLKTIELLQLSRKEVSILENLDENGNYTVADISRISRLPRMTLYPLLQILRKRGLLDYKRQGKRRYWFSTSPEALGQTLTKLGYDISQNKKLSVSVEDHTGFTLINGKEELFNVWRELAEDNPGERIRAIQPTKSLLSALQNYKPGEFVPINNAIKENKIVVESLIREDTFPSYIATHKNNPKVQKEILESFIGRSADAVFTSNKYLNNDSDLMITKDSALLINWQNQVGVKIENKDMVMFLYELFELARGYGKKVDQNEYLRELLSKI